MLKVGTMRINLYWSLFYDSIGVGTQMYVHERQGSIRIIEDSVSSAVLNQDMPPKISTAEPNCIIHEFNKSPRAWALKTTRRFLNRVPSVLTLSSKVFPC